MGFWLRGVLLRAFWILRGVWFALFAFLVGLGEVGGKLELKLKLGVDLMRWLSGDC